MYIYTANSYKHLKYGLMSDCFLMASEQLSSIKEQEQDTFLMRSWCLLCTI